jgi:hypothetical protein
MRVSGCAVVRSERTFTNPTLYSQLWTVRTFKLDKATVEPSGSGRRWSERRERSDAQSSRALDPQAAREVSPPI